MFFFCFERTVKMNIASRIADEGPPCRPPAVARDVVERVWAVLSLPEAELDYARAKVALDALVDPAADAEWTLAELGRLANCARLIAGRGASAAEKVEALRAVVYRNGAWNGFLPFDYDHDNFKELRVKLLSHYLETRRGNCVSMPILFLILADKLGLDMSLAMAPAHLFLRWRDEGGRVTNLETTSGADPARGVWIREVRGVTDRGVASGFYMRSLTRREGIAAMALTVVEHLMAQRRLREALTVTELILRCNPRDGMAWANQGQACACLIGSEYLDSYRSELLIPLPLRAEYLALLQRNHHAFATAKRLGWQSVN
jgi:regulator of sirC expression with transglutaminase-like and TPR domain